MAKQIVVYVGWIGGKETDRPALEALGVRVGHWNREATCWDGCEVPERVMDRLDREWGKWIWGLRREVRSPQRPDEDEDVPF